MFIQTFVITYHHFHVFDARDPFASAKHIMTNLHVQPVHLNSIDILQKALVIVLIKKSSQNIILSKFNISILLKSYTDRSKDVLLIQTLFAIYV